MNTEDPAYTFWYFLFAPPAASTSLCVFRSPRKLGLTLGAFCACVLETKSIQLTKARCCI